VINRNLCKHESLICVRQVKEACQRPSKWYKGCPLLPVWGLTHSTVHRAIAVWRLGLLSGFFCLPSTGKRPMLT